MHSDQIEGAPGTVSQVRGCAFELIRYAKENGVALVLVAMSPRTVRSPARACWNTWSTW
jgi:hypothetical protein